MELDQYSLIKTRVWNLLRIDLNHYKSEQMCRRLDSWLVRVNASSWDAYFKRLQNEPNELTRFRDYLTINVSEFFRDPERWQTLKDRILPDLLKENQRLHGLRGGLQIWSAGCSHGQEPYSLAILMNELAPYSNYSILATDLDRGAIRKAMARGPYTNDDIRAVSPDRREKYFETSTPPIYLKEKAAHNVHFRELNLLLDPFGENLDLIVCRNVIIYFTNDAKTELYRHFQAALRPGGILFLGGTEIIPHPAEFGFANQGISFYRKV